jgi:large subunit ribosomal protein L18
MTKKKAGRVRRATSTRAKIKELGVNRLTIHRTPRHIYAQVIAPSADTVLASASSLDTEIRTALKNGGNVDAAKTIGKFIAQRAVKAGVKAVAFDRSGFKYHGRIKALADSAREHGLEF